MPKKQIKSAAVAVAAPILDAAFIEKVSGPIRRAWNYIMADAGRCSNSGALELVLDADRIVWSAGQETKQEAVDAQALIDAAMDAYGYVKVSRYICRHIQLV